MIIELLPDRVHPIVLLGNPWAKKRPRISKPVAGKAPRTHQDRADKTAEGLTRAELQAAWPWQPLGGNVRLGVRFYRASRQIVDIDNLLKHLMDAAQGILWTNDCQVTALEVELELDRTNPRTELWAGPHFTSLIR